MYFCYQYVKKISIFHLIFLASRIYLQLEQLIGKIYRLWHFFTMFFVQSQSIYFLHDTSQSFKENKERTNHNSLSDTDTTEPVIVRVWPKNWKINDMVLILDYTNDSEQTAVKPPIQVLDKYLELIIPINLTY